MQQTVADWGRSKWSGFKSKLFKAGTDTLRDVAKDISDFGRRLEEKRRPPSRRDQEIAHSFSVELVHELILNDKPVPEDWKPLVTVLRFDQKPLFSLSKIVGFSTLEALDISRTKVRDLGPLTALGSQFKVLIASRIPADDIKPLSFISNLERLVMDGLSAENIDPLANLVNMRWLDLARSNIRDINPLSQLRRLIHLDISKTKVSDLSPLDSMNRTPVLQWLDVSFTQVKDLSPLIYTYSLRFLDVSGSRVTQRDFGQLGAVRVNLELVGGPP